MMLLIAVALVYLWALLLAGCGRGDKTNAPSWFDIIAHREHPTNRAARRASTRA